MRKMKRRAILCLLLTVILVLGLGYYVFKLAEDGGKWVTYPANQNVYHNGYLATGNIYDRNGNVLLDNSGSGPVYNDDYYVRCSTLHAVGDSMGNISTGANVAFSNRLIGYNFFTGTYTTNNKGRDLYLTLDADLCAAADQALSGRSGTVGIYNYKTGEIVCMVSSPNYDPTDPPDPENTSDGVYVNKFISSTVVPGSIFKVITSTAAIENISDLDDWYYECYGEKYYGDGENDRITCTYAHGTVDFEDALAVSCNCGYADLTLKLGPDTLKQYVEKAGLTKSYDINGIPTAKGTFDYPTDDVSLAWTGIGQYHDLVNPCSMMVYMGAIANGGSSANPTLIKDVVTSGGHPNGYESTGTTGELVKPDTAKKLDEMLHNNVVETYGEYNFYGLDLCAKSGTAEVGEGKEPNSWFTGYIRNSNYPYAFIVLIENGGSGASEAGSVSNLLLHVLVNDPDLAYTGD